MIHRVSKLYSSPTQTRLVVRKRPHVTNGGGLVVTDFTSQKEVFRVDGFGILGTKGELIVRDADGDALIFIRRKSETIEALSIYRKWKAHTAEKLVFCLKEPNCFLVQNNGIKIYTKPRVGSNKGWDFEIKGCFPEKHGSIVDSMGNFVAQVGIAKDEETLVTSKDLYQVMVKPGVDQAFVVGVISILDYIHGESTSC